MPNHIMHCIYAASIILPVDFCTIFRIAIIHLKVKNISEITLFVTASDTECVRPSLTNSTSVQMYLYSICNVTTVVIYFYNGKINHIKGLIYYVINDFISHYIVLLNSGSPS